MNEELEKAMNTVLKTIDQWDEQKTYELACTLQMQMSILKLLVGIERFDQLPAFTRILADVTKYIDKCNKQESK